MSRARFLLTPGAALLALGLLAIGCAARADDSFPPAPGELNLGLRVSDFGGVNRLSEVVTGGVPLPRGAVKDLEQLRVVDSAGIPVPSQFSVIDRWWIDDDPALRWVLVSFVGNVLANETETYYLRDDAAAHPATAHPATRLSVAEFEDRVVVVTGPLKFSVSKTAFNLFDEVWYDQNGDGQFSDNEQYVFSSPTNGGVLTSGDWLDQGYKAGQRYYSAAKPPVHFEIEELGACRVVIRVDGTHFAMAGDEGAPDGLYDYRVRIVAAAGSPALNVSYQLGNMKVKAEWKIPPIKDFEVATTVAFAGEHAAQFMFDTDPLMPPPMYREGASVNFAYPSLPKLWGRRVDDSRVSLYQDSSGGEQWRDLIPNNYNKRIFGGDVVPKVRFRGYSIVKNGVEEAAGWKSSGQMDVRSSGNRVEVPLRFAIDPTISNQKQSLNRGLTLTIRDFTQRYPKGLYGEKGRVAAKIFPEESERLFHLERSSARTHDMQFFFHGPTLFARHYDWLKRAYENPLMPLAPASWYAQVQAWDMGVARVASIPETEFDKEKFDGVRIGEEVYGWISPWNPGGQHWNESTQFAPWATRGDWGAFQSAEVSTRWARDLVRTQSECPPEQWKRFDLYLRGWNRMDECKINTLTYPGYEDSTKWIGIPDSGHAGQLMLLEHYRLTGDRFSREAVERLALRGRAYPWRSLEKGDPTTDPTIRRDNRYSAWPLFNAMQGASLTGDKGIMEESRKVVLSYLNAVRYSPIGWMCLTINEVGSPQVYGKQYTLEKRGPGASAVYANFQFALVVIAIAKYYEETGDEDARDVILATCDMLVNRSLLRDADGKPAGWSYCWGDVWGSNAESGGWNDDVVAAVGYGYRVSGRPEYLEALQAAYEATKHSYKPFAQVGYACVVHPRADQEAPSAVVNLAARAQGNGAVALSWRAPGGDGNKGRASKYQVKYSRVEMVERVTDWPPTEVELPKDKEGYRVLADAHLSKVCSFYQAYNVHGEPVPGQAGKKESFVVEGLEPGKYWFALKSLDAAHNLSDISNIVTVDVR